MTVTSDGSASPTRSESTAGAPMGRDGGHGPAEAASEVATAATTSDSEDDETWALELEEELLMDDADAACGPRGQGPSPNPHRAQQPQQPQYGALTTFSRPGAPPTTHRRPQSLANELPPEVLVHIVSFTPVGRVSKAWSLASSTIARRKFSARLAETLLAFTPDAAAVAQDVEAALFAAFGQSYSLPKSYGQKARQLLFNLKDARNAALRERLFSGELAAPALVRMRPQDMANPQLVRQRAQWIKKRTHEVMRDTRALDGFTQSELFECRSCGSHRTCYRQWRRKAIVDRTRVIILCLDCPYRWEL